MNRQTVERNTIFEENIEVYCTWLGVLQYNKILYNLQSEQQHPTSKKSMIVYKTPVQFRVTSTTPTVPRVQRQHIRYLYRKYEYGTLSSEYTVRRTSNQYLYEYSGTSTGVGVPLRAIRGMT